MNLTTRLISALAITLLISFSAQAETTKSPKKKNQVAKEAVAPEVKKTEPVAELPKATGPVSFGPVKIGMSKAALEALTAQDGYYLKAPLTDYVYPKEISKVEGVNKVEGIDKFDGMLLNPVSGKINGHFIQCKNADVFD